METRPSFTGHSRRRKTSRLVRLGEILSRLFITIGGIGTIIAVALVCVFLVWVVIPLFRGAAVSQMEGFPLPWKEARPLRVAVDEYQTFGWALFPDGMLVVFRLDNGHVLERRPLFPGQILTACSPPSRAEEIAFGFADGSVRLGRIGFTTSFLEPKDVPSALRELHPGKLAEFGGGLVSRTPQGQLRAQKIRVDLEDPVKSPDPSAILLIDLSMRPGGPVVSTLTANGKLRISSVTVHDDFQTGEKVKELEGGELALPYAASSNPSPKGGRGDLSPPNYLFLSGVGDNVYLIWKDGHLVRISTQVIEKPKVVEEVELLEMEGMSLTALQFLIGKTTLLAGDSSGRVRAWFRVKPANAPTADGAVLVATHELAGAGVPVTALATSARTRMIAAGYADGRVHLFYLTSEKSLAEVRTGHDQPLQGLAFAPKDDGLIAWASAPQSAPAQAGEMGGVWHWSVDPRHPEVTLSALFRPVWYEGSEKPAHVWQSSSGTDEFEPKFGLWPLVFGTMKATFYSLLLGVPLALMGAIYTSEFLHPRMRALVKPSIELMASLPSVVLGFLAALVLAPFVERVLPAVLAALVTVPVAFLLGAYVWQLLPEKLGQRLSRWRFLFIVLVLPLGCVGAMTLGPWIELLFFHGDLKKWLSFDKPLSQTDFVGADQFRNSTSGWMFLLLPVCALAMAFLLAQVNPRFRRLTAHWNRPGSAVADLAKFFAAALFTLVLAFVLAALLNGLGFDPRGSVVGTYVQRNALVVGFIMGFAIIPIIYTIAEDALSAVPEHLRSASLGCGATHWQTARRIIIPTAMSGLFSAVMIGLGRAVGETMIVLMATGNTPVMEMNVFNGFRTLSANIAVELPEAVRDSTHYRMLFLAALTLFAMTFALNTVAEMIRLRFRRRAYQL